MSDHLALLQNTPLFTGLSLEALSALLPRLGASVRHYGRGEALVQAGLPSRSVGILLEGELAAARCAPDGAQVPIVRLLPGGVFGDVLGGSSMASPVTVTAQSPCTVLLIPYQQLLAPDGSPEQLLVLHNLLRSISDKYFLLMHRVDLLVLHSLRAKLAAYLLAEAARAGQPTFTIPFTRAQLAEYLNCDRSALSRELSRMQRDGLLDTYRSSFKLLNEAALRSHLQ